MFSLPICATLVAAILAAMDVNEEILPANCNCRDWYGGCRRSGEKWTDEETWSYECSSGSPSGSNANFLGCLAATGDLILLGVNKTIDNLWHSCEGNSLRLKYETEPHCLVNGSSHKLGESWRDGRFQWLCLETGRWVTGCYFANETDPNVFLKIGETGYNGLIKHVCDRFVDYPGRVQYHAEVRNDVHVKHPTNKGTNKNFPEAADLTLKEPINRWHLETAALFVAGEEATRTKIRFLPASRTTW